MKRTNMNRRQFFSFVAPLAILPVVGPHVLLSNRPKYFPGWRKDPLEFTIIQHTVIAKSRRLSAEYTIEIPQKTQVYYDGTYLGEM